MIKIGNKNITAVLTENKAISIIISGGIVLWEAIRSVFGNGYWVNEKPWSNTEGWKN